MPDNDREVFKYFREQKNTSREIDHLAYAAYAYAKYEWMEHFETINKRAPDIHEENAWIKALPQSRYEEITNGAIDFFEFAARRYMQEEIEDERKDAVNTSILREVRRATKFSSTFVPNLFIGIVASLVFTLLVILFGYIFNDDPSPIALFKSLGPVSPAPHQVINPPN